MVVISVSATKSYLYAFPACVRSIATAAAHHKEAHFVFCTDKSEESNHAEELLKSTLPEGWKITTIRLDFGGDDKKDYDRNSQLRIAALQGAGFAFAKAKIRPELYWNVESDTIVPANALRVLEWTLQMPQEDGSPYYEIAAATYPNGLFLGGFGTYQNPIAEDFLPKERKLSPRLAGLLVKCESRLKDPNISATQRIKEISRISRIHKLVKDSPPDGNIWEVTAKHGWRRRGWLDFAYPGIGKGSIVPVDWCGLGCTLLSRRALQLADFNGYIGAGTQDLFLCWNRWNPAGLKIACVPHVTCDHIKPNPSRPDEFVHYRTYHEPEGEHRGHLRVKAQPYVPL